MIATAILVKGMREAIRKKPDAIALLLGRYIAGEIKSDELAWELGKLTGTDVYRAATTEGPKS